MDAETQKRLEDDGWVFGDVQSFLGLSDAEMAYVDLRIALRDAVVARRLALGWTVGQAAERVGITRSQLARMEEAHPSVSCDRLIRALFALGVTLRELARLIADDVQSHAA
jgi:Helix-turn-helix